MFGRFRRVARRTARRTSRRMGRRAALWGEPPEDSSSQPSYAGELEELDRLRKQGVISEQVFEAKKRKLLGL